MCNAFHTFNQNLFSHLPSGMTRCTEEDDDDDDNLPNAEAATTRPPRKKPKKADKANESQPGKVETTQGETMNDDGDAEGKGRLDLARMLEDARKAIGKPSQGTDP